MGLESSFERVDLGRATDALYEAFAAYPLKERIDTCPHCELDAAERRLHVRLLREMRWSDFGPYPFKALTSFGEEEDLKHFLPRILELYVSDHAGAPYTLFMVFGKLDQAQWLTWPAGEVAAIRRFVDAWQRALAREAHESDESAWELDELRAGISAL
jgi:hypothetical protein